MTLKRRAIQVAIFCALGFPLVSGSPIEASPHSLTASVFASQRFNDGFSLLSAIPKPILSYHFIEPGRPEFHVLSAVLLHRFESRIPINESLKWTAGLETFIWKAGDEPKIDGESLETYSFSAHRFGGWTGIMTRFGPAPYRFDSQLRYETHYLMPYDRGIATDFAPPSSFFEHGLIFSLDPAGGRLPSELFHRGLRPNFAAEAAYRHGHRSFGVGGLQKKVTWWGATMAHIEVNAELTSDLTGVLQTGGSWNWNADRLNAAKGGAWRRDLLGILTGDLRMDRVWASELAMRWKFSDSPVIGVKPYAFFMAYRELLMDRLRTSAAGGGGVKLMGMHQQKVFWNLLYGFIAGDRRDQDLTHEVRGDVGYKFF